MKRDAMNGARGEAEDLMDEDTESPLRDAAPVEAAASGEPGSAPATGNASQL